MIILGAHIICAPILVGDMNINAFLKRVGKTKIQLAEEIELSRPTLNQYIELFETGQKIANERYEIIFRRLFADQTISKEQFDRRMDSVKYLLERDRRYDIGNLDPEAADIVARIHNNMVKDMSDGQWDKKVYDGILILFSSYKNNIIMRELASYFSDLNSDSDLTCLSDESKAYYSYYYDCFHNIIDGTPVFNPESYEQFLNRKEALSKDREKRQIKKTQKIRSKFERVLKEVECEFKSKGMDASEDEITAEVIRRIGK